MTDASLQHTPLFALHEELGAKMVPFAGYAMPVQYPLGVKQEHLHTRAAAGLFDVSHMGQVVLTGPDVAKALESLVPVDVMDLPEGKQRYGLLTNDEGGIRDDLMIGNLGDRLLLVINAACKHEDIAYMRAALPADIGLDVLSDHALLALQGPEAAAVLARFAPAIDDMVFMDTRAVTVAGVACTVSRAGYTGEDGFEISVPAQHAEALARKLLEQPEVAPIGLGARDSLRLESGLCLYGHDIDTRTTPAEASLVWAISKVRRANGARAGGFPGAEIILEQLASRQLTRQRVGLQAQGRAPVREGTTLVNEAGDVIGQVTSGTFGPSVNAPIAMAYVDAACANPNTPIGAVVRGKILPMTVTSMPFITQRYHRS